MSSTLRQSNSEEKPPTIVDCLGRDFEDILRRARAAILAANDPPTLFPHQGRPAVVGPDGRMQFLDEHSYRAELTRLLRWKAHTRRGRAPWGVTHITFAEAADLFPPFEKEAV